MYSSSRKEPRFTLSSNNLKDEYQLSFLNPEVVDVIFPEGPTYVTLSKTIYGTPFVHMFRRVSSKEIAPIEACKEVELGDLIIAINGESTTDLTYNDFTEKAKTSPRPMKLRFAKPESDTKLFEPHPNRPEKMVEWKHNYVLKRLMIAAFANKDNRLDIVSYS